MTKREDFRKVYRFGKSAANHQFVIYYMNQPQIDRFRLGISVSKKVGNAVTRNRLRRVIKEIVRLSGEKIKPQTDFILIVRKPAAELDYAEISKSVMHVLGRAGMINKRSR